MVNKIYILGHFGGYNTGDEAMLGGFLSILPKSTKVIVKYKNGINIDWGENVQLFHGSYKNFVSNIAENDAIVLCGGTHFHDDYNFSRLARHWAYLSRIIYLFHFCKLKKARRLCIGNGFGPINHPITKVLTRIFCKYCDVLTVRDSSSLEVLNNLNIKADLVHKDLATLLQNKEHTANNSKSVIGVSLTSVVVQKRGYIDDEQLLNSLHEQLVSFDKSNPACLFKLFVIRSGNRESDYEITESLHTRLIKSGLNSEIYAFDNNLESLLNEFRTCNIFLASRFHSAVLATVSNCKLVILSYHHKLISFAQEAKIDHEFVYDLQDKNILDQLKNLPNSIDKLYKLHNLNYEIAINEPEDLKQKLLSFL